MKHMVLIQVDLPKELSDQIKIYSILNNLSNKEDGIIKILGEKFR